MMVVEEGAPEPVRGEAYDRWLPTSVRRKLRANQRNAVKHVLDCTMKLAGSHKFSPHLTLTLATLHFSTLIHPSFSTPNYPPDALS